MRYDLIYYLLELVLDREIRRVDQRDFCTDVIHLEQRGEHIRAHLKLPLFRNQDALSTDKVIFMFPVMPVERGMSAWFYNLTFA
jgi:hypothetical protein